MLAQDRRSVMNAHREHMIKPRGAEVEIPNKPPIDGPSAQLPGSIPEAQHTVPTITRGLLRARRSDDAAGGGGNGGDQDQQRQTPSQGQTNQPANPSQQPGRSQKELEEAAQGLESPSEKAARRLRNLEKEHFKKLSEMEDADTRRMIEDYEREANDDTLPKSKRDASRRNAKKWKKYLNMSDEEQKKQMEKWIQEQDPHDPSNW